MNSYVDYAIFTSVDAQKLNKNVIFLKAVEISSPFSDSYGLSSWKTSCLFSVPYQ